MQDLDNFLVLKHCLIAKINCIGNQVHSSVVELLSAMQEALMSLPSAAKNKTKNNYCVI